MDLDDASEAALWTAAAEAEGVDRAEILHVLGARLYHREAYEESAAAAETAANLFADHKMPRDEGFSRLGYGISTQRLNRLEDALAAFDQASSLFGAAVDEVGIATCQERAAQVLVALGRPDEALQRGGSAMGLFVSNGAPERAADVGLKSGEILGRLGRQSEALEMFLQARQWFRADGNAVATAKVDDRIAAALIELGRLTEAVERLRAVLYVQLATDDPRQVAYARYRLGWTLTMADDHEEALDHLKAARKDYIELQDTLGVARCDLQAGNALSNLGRTDTAIGLYRQARAVFDAHGHDSDMLIADANLAVAYERSGRLEEAVVINRRVLVAADDNDDDYLRATVTTRLGRNLLALGQPNQAAALLGERETVQVGRDNVMEGSRLDLLRAKVLLKTGVGEAARDLAGAVIARLSGTSLLSELAEANAILSDLALDAGEQETGERYRAQAIALHLACGDDDEATELSHYFLRSQHPTRPPTLVPAPMPPDDQGPERATE